MSNQNIKHPPSSSTTSSRSNPSSNPPPIVIPKELMLDRTRLRPTPSRVRAPSPLDRSNYQHLFNPRQTNSPNNLKPSSIRSIIQNQPSTTTTAPQPPVLHKNLSPANYLTSIIPTPPHPTTTNNTLGSLPSVSVLGTDPSPVLPPASVSVRGGSSGRVQNFTSADETDVSQSSQSPSRPPRNSSSCQTEALIDTSHGQETALIVNTSSDQDKVQPWQSQLLPHIGQISQSDPCTLERANSAAARLDSLARLNGIKPRPSLQSSTSDTCRAHFPRHHPSGNSSESDESDCEGLPPFLMAKHIEETERKAALINLANGANISKTIVNQPALPSIASDLNLYPFANHTGLGFGVGPNGRGVPRLSALQRKALEKMALNRNQSTDVVSHTTSLSRSHTTTCTESVGRLHLTNRLLDSQKSQQPYNPKLTHSSSDSHQRQEARSNLIRKLSSRGNLGSRLRNPPAATLPTSNQDHQPSLPSPPLPGADSQLQFMRPRPRSGSLNDLPLKNRFWADCRPTQNGQGLMDPPHPIPAPPSASIDKQQSLSFQAARTQSTSLPRTRQAASSTHSSVTTRASLTSETSNFTLNSEFRSYRHSIERDRDSVLDRMGLLDNTLEREMNSPERALPTLDGAPRRLNSSRSLRSRRSTSDKDITHSQKSLTPVVESNSNTKVLSHKVSAHRHTSSDSQSVNLERRTSQGLRYSGLSISRSRPTSSTRLSASISRSRRSTSENLASSSTVNSIYSSSHLTEVAPSPKKHQTDSDLKSDAASTEKLAGIKRTNSGVSSRIYSRASVSSRIDKSLASGRNSSLISRESLVKKPRGNSPKALREIKAETSTSQKDELDFVKVSKDNESRSSQIAQSISVSEPVSSSGNESSYQERVSRALDEISRGSDASVPSNASADWPSMPNKLSTHTPSQSVLNRAANSAIEEIAEGESISAQFSSSSHPVGTHMPVASAADLARYNDSKLAPFPALFSRTSPPSSPERSKSPIGSTAKVIKDRSHGILSNASNFFHGGNRNRSGGLSNGPGPGGVKLFTKGAETSKLMHQSMNIRSTGEDLEEVADSVGTHLNKEHFERKEGPIDDSILSRTSSTTGSIQSSAIKASSVARQNQILGRLGPFLKPSNEPGRIGRRHSLLNDPPRKLWWHSPVLQVVNPTSVKDRYIFLFNDLLVITKPIIEFEIRGEGKAPKLPITLGSHYFLTKNVVKVQDLRFANLISDGMASNHQSHERGGSVEFGGGIKLTGQTSFTVDFAKNAEMAIQRLIANHGIKDDSSSIGKLLISTPDLDSRQLGDYLSRPEHGGVLKNYLDRLKFSQLKIDDGLRLLLLSLRLPNETEAIERVLIAFGAAWSAANERVGVTPSLAARMALGMIILSEELHHSLHDSMKTVASCIGYPNGIKSEIDFIDSFKNRRNYVPLGNEEDGSMLARNEAVGMSLIIGEVQLDALLKKLYLSVRRDRLIQARATAEETDTIEISAGGDHSDGAKLGKVLPSRLIYQIESDLVTLTLPEPDPHFGIKLFSTGVRFEPAFLSFSESRSCSFRIKGKTIGISQISFIKIGSRAAAYVGLPLISSILVERAFMKDTVQVTFMNHFQASRKYLFSFDGSSSKKEFISLISKAQKSEAEKDDKKARSGPQAVGRVASLQVLRDTLIPNDDLMAFHANPYRYTTIELKPKSKLPPESSTSSKQNNSDLKTETPGASQRVRSNSLSETYIYTTGSREKELQDAIIQRRQAAQLSYLKKKQQKILQERMRKNLEGGKQGLNPYSVLSSEREAIIGAAGGFEVSSFGLVGNNGKHVNENSSSNGEVKLEVESVDLIYKKYWRNGEKLVRECEQNSLLPLVLGFLSMGIEQKGGLNANGHYVGLKNR